MSPDQTPKAPSDSRIDLSVKPLHIFVAAVVLVIAASAAWYFVWRPFPVDSALAHYTVVPNVSGKLVSVGSDTLADIMSLSTEAFRQIYPNVVVELEHKGSGTAPAALTEGRSQLGPMSRPMSAEELSAFESKHGYKPTAYRIALDALAYVNKGNPLRDMTLQQLDAVYSSAPKRGGTSVTTWGGLGLTGDWAGKAIELYGRDAVSGTHDYFKQQVLQNADFKGTVHEDISEGVVESVVNDSSGIGYSGIGWKTSGVRTLALGEAAGHFVTPTYEHALDGSYPIARFLYVYVNQKPGQPLDPVTGEFIKYILSYEGQKHVVQAKFFPLPAKVAAETLAGKN
jgi:phosphate transport system substrate-binding protein